VESNVRVLRWNQDDCQDISFRSKHSNTLLNLFCNLESTEQMARKPKTSTTLIALASALGGLAGYFLGGKAYFLIVPGVASVYFFIYREHN
jgi:hypothetical protein